MNFTGRKYLRKTVPLGERVTAPLIVALLAGLGVGIALMGRHYDPHRFSLDPSVLKTAQSAGPALPETIPGGVPTEGVSQPASPAANAGTPAAPAQPAAVKGPELETRVAGVRPLGPTEFYTADTLYIKIDGRSDIYLAYKVAGLRCRSFGAASPISAASPNAGSTSGADATNYVDIYDYDMGKPAQAFGIFAAERGTAATQPVDFVKDGYRSGQGFFFRQGAHYVQVQSSAEDAGLMKTAEALARDLAATLPASDEGLQGQQGLPATGQVAGTKALTTSSGNGVEFLDNMSSAEYDFEGQRLKFFLADLPDEAAARKAFDSYKNVDTQYGQIKGEREAGGSKLFEAESYGNADVVFIRGKQVGGVAEAKSADAARKFVDQYLAGQLK